VTRPEPARAKAAPLDRRAIAAAGHLGDRATAAAGFTSSEPLLRATALTALERAGALDNQTLLAGLSDPSPIVRRRAAQLAARYPDTNLVPLLADPDATVVEMAAWSCGEHESTDPVVVDALIEVVLHHDDALARESAVAALGAIGDDRGLPAILSATKDKPAIRRRAVIALAPFDTPEVHEALARAKTDRDKQVRRAAEDLE
jgi:HEAT repeat protein